MTTQTKINEKIKAGKIVHNYGGTLKQTECFINVSESLEFMDFLRSIAIEKGTSNGLANNGKLNVTNHWYHIGKGDIEIATFTGKAITDKTKFYKLIWTPIQ